MTDIIRLNVGGIIHITTKQTLCYPGSYFEVMFSGQFAPGKDVDGAIFLDRDGALFHYVLEYLRNPDLWIPPNDLDLIGRLIGEADFFALTGMLKILTDLAPHEFTISFVHERIANKCNIRNVPDDLMIYYDQYYNSEGYAEIKRNNSSNGVDINSESDSDSSSIVVPEPFTFLSPHELRFMSTIKSKCLQQYKMTHHLDVNRVHAYTFTSDIKSNVQARLVQIMREKAALERSYGQSDKEGKKDKEKKSKKEKKEKKSKARTSTAIV